EAGETGRGAQLEGTSPLPARELYRHAEARLHLCRLAVPPGEEFGAQPVQLGFEHALVRGHAEGILDRRGGRIDRAAGSVGLRQPVEVETVRDALPRGAIDVEPLSELGDALVVPTILGEGRTADDRGQTHEQREPAFGGEGDQRVDVFECAPWLSQEDVERAG